MPPIFLILSAWFVLSFIFCGWGLGLRRLFGVKEITGAGQLLDGLWTGWALVIFFLQIWHLFFPVNMAAFLIVFVVGLCGFLGNRQGCLAVLKQKRGLSGLEIGLACLCAAFGFLTAVQATRPPLFYDAGLYYLPTINWTMAYPVVPGLGNLHSRLAFNQSYFLYVALLETWSRQASHLANSLLFFALEAEIVVSLRNFLDNRRTPRMNDLFMVLLAPVILHQLFLVFLASPAPDLAIFTLCILLSSRLLRLLEDGPEETRQKDFSVISMLILVLLGVTIKATFNIFGGVALIIAFVVLLGRRKSKTPPDLRKIACWSLLIAVPAIGAWIARSILLTGYCAYPIPVAPFPVDWRVPHASVARIWGTISSYARHSGSTKEDAAFYVSLPAALGAFGVCASLFTGWTKKNAAINKKIWPFLLPCAVATLYWYIAAPNLRFAMALFWILGAGLLLQWINGLKNPKFPVGIYLIGFAVFILVQYKFYLQPGVVFYENKIAAAAQEKLTFNQFTTNSGLKVAVPAQEDRCWNGPLICTPYPHPGLVLRNPENIRDGFRVEPRDESDATVGFYHPEPPQE